MEIDPGGTRLYDPLYYETVKHKKTSNTEVLKVVVASPRIELGSGASETLILSIVLRGHYYKRTKNQRCPTFAEASVGKPTKRQTFQPKTFNPSFRLTLLSTSNSRTSNSRTSNSRTSLTLSVPAHSWQIPLQQWRAKLRQKTFSPPLIRLFRALFQ